MENIAIKKFYRETDKFLNRRVRVSGWIRTVRSSNTTGFMELNDGSFFKGLQIIFENEAGCVGVVIFELGTTRSSLSEGGNCLLS